MRTFSACILCLAAVVWALVGPAASLRSDDDPTTTSEPTDNPSGNPKPEKREKPDKSQSETPAPPADKQLTALHNRFVSEAEKLAKQYLKTKQPDKAMAVYEEILKIVPDNEVAQEALGSLKKYETTARHLTFEVQANRDWQDTGIRVIAGKPLKLVATGTWELNMSHELGPDGLEMPKILKDFKLGSLIGMIDDPNAKESKPFYIGLGQELTPEESGPLKVRIHDSDPKDNQGSIKLEITGRFDK